MGTVATASKNHESLPLHEPNNEKGTVFLTLRPRQTTVIARQFVHVYSTSGAPTTLQHVHTPVQLLWQC